ncbi:MAG: zinc-binding alcohol dehydrogenase [Dehalococcoidia bacterium]
MRQASLYFTAPYQVAIEEAPLRSPTKEEVLVETLVSAISPGTEMLVYRGQAPADLPVDETIPALRGGFDFPMKYGYALVGRVVKAGPNPEPHKEGDLVFSFHPHESRFISSPQELLPVPAGIPPEDAAFLANMESAVNFVMDGRPAMGEQVAVFGQGIVGLLTTALLARTPLASLVTLDRYPIRRRASLEMGAKFSLDPEGPDALSRVRACLQGERSYAGADLSYELSGNPEALDTAISVTGFNGRIVIGSWYGTKESRLDLGGKFHRSRVQLISSQVSTIGPEWSGRWTKARRLDVAWTMVRLLRPSRLITHRFPLEEAAKAYELVDRRPDQAIQVMLTYSP